MNKVPASPRELTWWPFAGPPQGAPGVISTLVLGGHLGKSRQEEGDRASPWRTPYFYEGMTWVVGGGEKHGLVVSASSRQLGARVPGNSHMRPEAAWPFAGGGY